MSTDALLPLSNSVSDNNINNTLVSRESKSLNKSTISQMSRATLSNFQPAKPKFKRHLNYLIRAFDKKPSLLSFLKLLFGLLIISTPAAMVGVYPYYSQYIYLKYYMLPFITCAALACGLLILLFVYRVGDDIRTRGMLIASWERKNILKLMHCIVMTIFIIWIFKTLENLTTNFSYMKEYVSQNKIKIEEYKEMNLGMYWINVFFCSFFWDEKFDTLSYFDITNHFITLLNNNISRIFSSVTSLAMIYLIKLIFCKTKNEVPYFIITLMVLYECILYYVYNWSTYTAYHSDGSKMYKYIELIPLLIIVLCSLYLSVKRYPIGIFKRKFATYVSHKVNLFTLIILIISFIVVLGGIGCLGGSIIYLLFSVDITPSLKIKKIKFFKNLLWLGIILFCLGNSFFFGHYSFNLIFKPIAYESFPAVLKNPFYLKANVKGKRLKRFMTHSHKSKKNPVKKIKI